MSVIIHVVVLNIVIIPESHISTAFISIKGPPKIHHYHLLEGLC